MAVGTDEVREIVDFAPEGFLVTSFFLNVDATEFPSDDLLATSFDSLIHDAESRRKDIEDTLSHDGEQSLRKDLEKIREFFDAGINRTDTKGVAIFSCSGMDFWQVFQIPTPVQNRVVFDSRPYVGPIAAFLSHSKPTAILLTDRQQARIFTMKAGEVREWTSFQDWVPQRTEQGGWSQNRYQRRSDKWARHHIDRAAELTLELLKHYPFDWLILGYVVNAQHDLENDLHPYLKDRVIGRISVRIDAPAEEVIQEARALQEQKEGELIDDLMGRVQEYAGAGGRGTIGPKDTLQALNEQKIHILLVQDGFSHPGSVCTNCQFLSLEQTETCPACGGTATPMDNIVDIAIQRAMELGSEVEVATEFNKLEPIDCIGSIMYY